VSITMYRHPGTQTATERLPKIGQGRRGDQAATRKGRFSQQLVCPAMADPDFIIGSRVELQLRDLTPAMRSLSPLKAGHA
jgi:hypothetical protein